MTNIVKFPSAITNEQVLDGCKLWTSFVCVGIDADGSVVIASSADIKTPAEANWWLDVAKTSLQDL